MASQPPGQPLGFHAAYEFVTRHGLASFCHVFLNANEFLLID